MDKAYKKIYNLELSLLLPKVRSSCDKLDILLADDFMEFGSSGLVYKKKDILKRLPAATVKAKYIVSDFKIKSLAEDIVQTTFITKRFINKETAVSLRSSLWRKNGNSWQIFFHQGTIV